MNVKLSKFEWRKACSRSFICWRYVNSQKSHTHTTQTYREISSSDVRREMWAICEPTRLGTVQANTEISGRAMGGCEIARHLSSISLLELSLFSLPKGKSSQSQIPLSSRARSPRSNEVLLEILWEPTEIKSTWRDAYLYYDHHIYNTHSNIQDVVMAAAAEEKKVPAIWRMEPDTRGHCMKVPAIVDSA